jgi:hypothetical protein
VRSYRTVSPLPRARERAAVCFLWRCPWGRPPWPLASTLPDGARTFLRSASAAGDHPAPSGADLSKSGLPRIVLRMRARLRAAGAGRHFRAPSFGGSRWAGRDERAPVHPGPEGRIHRKIQGGRHNPRAGRGERPHRSCAPPPGAGRRRGHSGSTRTSTGPRPPACVRPSKACPAVPSGTAIPVALATCSASCMKPRTKMRTSASANSAETGSRSSAVNAFSHSMTRTSGVASVSIPAADSSRRRASTRGLTPPASSPRIKRPRVVFSLTTRPGADRRDLAATDRLGQRRAAATMGAQPGWWRH